MCSISIGRLGQTKCIRALRMWTFSIPVDSYCLSHQELQFCRRGRHNWQLIAKRLYFVSQSALNHLNWRYPWTHHRTFAAVCRESLMSFSMHLVVGLACRLLTSSSFPPPSSPLLLLKQEAGAEWQAGLSEYWSLKRSATTLMTTN